MSGADILNDQQKQAYERAMTSGQIPQVFFNSFTNGFSATEVNSVLSCGPRMVATFIMAPAVAKSYALSLLEVVDQYEKAIGEKVPTMQDLVSRLALSMSGQTS